jgi:oxygen-independent coproporphyrinogen-3 oxidase
MSDFWTTVPFDRALIKKYDRPGPRYTSYPPAPHFSDDFGPADYRGLLAASARAGRPLSLYVHLPFCRHRCLYCGCNVQIARDRGRGHSYLEVLAREVAAVAAALGAGKGEREVVQVHWGGGTPTFLVPDDLRALMALLRRHFHFAPNAEIGVEVDPRECSPEHLDALAEGGVNRLSLGVQDLDDEVQQAVRRVQPAELVRAVMEGARARGMTSLNVDLIYGLPHQTPARFAETVDEVLAMAPDRLAVFNFAYLPAMFPHQKALDTGALPDADTKLTLLQNVVERLTGAGYLFIGMDHFARPEDPLARALCDRALTRNFQGYSTWGDTDLIGFGVSAIGQVAGGYSQNVRTVAEYEAAVAAGGGLAAFRGLAPSPEDLLRREVIVRLMCHFRLAKAEVAKRHGIDFDEHFRAELEELGPLAEDGLVELSADRITITPLGRLLVRNVAMAFDAYRGVAKAQYSRTV